MQQITIGTRGSELAMTQTRTIIQRLRQQWPGLEITVEQIRTKGDRVTDTPLNRIGGDGVFVSEIEQALRTGRIDLAVHSLKDLPTAQSEDLRVMVVGPREDVQDVFVVRERMPMIAMNGQEMPYAPVRNFRIGTCSLRRMAQLRLHYPDAQILPLRGNVGTRLRKLDAGDYDVIVLAAAGLNRLALDTQLDKRIIPLPLASFLSAPGQGALALEARAEPKMLELLAPLRDAQVEATTAAERMFMRWLGAGCYLPVAAYGEFLDDQLALHGLVISLDGQRQVRVSQSVRWEADSENRLAEHLGIRLAEQALEQGAAEIIREINTDKVQEHQGV